MTWVGGARDWDDLDDTSRKILAATSSGTSIFDPVVCELSYRWFCPPGGHVLDPFAGGSVRGIVASVLGYRYTGIDLRGEQTAANRTQAAEICIDPRPCWYTGDSMEIDQFAPEPADLIFTCPPYADLERYSDDPRDLSTMGYEDFVDGLTKIVAKSAAILRKDRFACVVVGDIRDKRGHYRGLPRHTIGAFEAAGMPLYNDAILVTSVGSLPVRTGKQFTASRKLGKTHQNILVFIKGSAKAATLAQEEAGPGE